VSNSFCVLGHYVEWAIKTKKNCFLNNQANGVNETKLAFALTVKYDKLFVCLVLFVLFVLFCLFISFVLFIYF